MASERPIIAIAPPRIDSPTRGHRRSRTRPPRPAPGPPPPRRRPGRSPTIAPNRATASRSRPSGIKGRSATREISCSAAAATLARHRPERRDGRNITSPGAGNSVVGLNHLRHWMVPRALMRWVGVAVGRVEPHRCRMPLEEREQLGTSFPMAQRCRCSARRSRNAGPAGFTEVQARRSSGRVPGRPE